jgi:hypothetical protein
MGLGADLSRHEKFRTTGIHYPDIPAKVSQCFEGKYMGKLQRKTAKASTTYGEQVRP